MMLYVVSQKDAVFYVSVLKVVAVDADAVGVFNKRKYASWSTNLRGKENDGIGLHLQLDVVVCRISACLFTKPDSARGTSKCFLLSYRCQAT